MPVLRVIALWVPLAAGMAAAPCVAQSAPASRPAVATPSIEGFVAERVARLAPGVHLNFSVFGSERAAVSVYVEGLPTLVDLHEVQPGVYEGSHVMAAGDRPRADGDVVATLQRGGQSARVTLAEPLVLASAPLPWGEHASDGRASAGPVPVSVESLSPMGQDRRVPVFADAPSQPETPSHAAALRCDSCAVVESIRVVEAPAPESLSGKVNRALEGHHRRVLGLLDAIGVPFAGRESRRLAERATQFEVTLRLPDGRVVARRYDTRPALQVGDTVSLPPAPARIAVGA
ncbi:MAG: hypothetical protein ABIO71_05245 [Caldimonas sp.]